MLKHFEYGDRHKFRKEAQRLCQLDHPHILKLSAVIFHSDIDGESAYVQSWNSVFEMMGEISA